MSDALTKLFSDFDRSLLSRRRLLQALGAAAVVRPVSMFAQGQCGGARAGTPECDTTPAKAPFAATGWQTVWLDYFSMQVADYQKEAAYFATLMNWPIRSDDGKQALLDIGDIGGLLIRGGYTPPSPPAGASAGAPARGNAAGAAAAAGGAAGGGAAGSGAPGGGRGGGGGGRGPRMATFDSFCFGIAPWDTKKVEAELKARGLNPIADHRGNDFQSFHVKDPNGWDLQLSNGSRQNRRRGPANAKMVAPAPFDKTAWKTLFVDHISFEVSNYKEAVAFYEALIGWKPGQDEGSQNEVKIGNFGGAIIRRGGGGGGRGAAAPDPAAPPPPRRASIGHIAFGITPWDADAVKAELDKRGLNGRVDTGGNGDIHTAKYQSYHTTTPNGFDLQISNVVT
ncbi:MAG TPA: VOC family protein [Vicinamibacterales bacterium]|nr:VOC family protein [Vicinamibacterales bacterium]